MAMCIVVYMALLPRELLFWQAVPLEIVAGKGGNVVNRRSTRSPATGVVITIEGMDPTDVKQLAQNLLAGTLSVDDFVGQLSSKTADLGEVALDLDRASRCGFPEVVYGEGKSVETIEKIFDRLVAEGADVLATRIDAAKAEALLAKYVAATYNAVARTIRIAASGDGGAATSSRGRITIITAGTSDLPVAEEARETAEWTGAEVTMVHDVGVAGPHRLPERLADLRDADAVVVVAGMEGALPSVAGGYLACPVIAVPTSVGYGASLGGIAALLSMLNSCASNVAVVNIDAGFKGGYMAGLIAKQVAAARRCRANEPKGE